MTQMKEEKYMKTDISNLFTLVVWRRSALFLYSIYFRLNYYLLFIEFEFADTDFRFIYSFSLELSYDVTQIHNIQLTQNKDTETPKAKKNQNKISQ